MSSKKEVSEKETKVKKTVAKKAEAKEKKVVKKSEVKEKKVAKEEVVEKKVTKKEVKEKKEVLLTKKEQKYFKGLSKAVRIISKIFRVCLMIIIPFIVLMMIMVPLVFKHYEVNANIIKFDDISVIVREDTISFKLADNVYAFDCNLDEMDQIISFLTEKSTGVIVLTIELFLLCSAVIIILGIYTLIHFEKLFDNFVNESTPFTKENTNYIFKIAVYLCELKVLSFIFSIVFMKTGSINFISIIEILIVFISYFVFKYATGMQKKVDTKIYE